MKVAIIGGGAAGFFSAITVKENYPEADVIIYEKSSTVLAKVKVSGGGRCNVTNACKSISELSKAYPRGGKQLKKAFQKFKSQDAMQWFQSRGVPLVIERDNCVFPKSQNSQSIIDCFLNETERLNINVKVSVGIKSFKSIDEKIELEFIDKNLNPLLFDKVIIATGGSPKRDGLKWIEDLHHKIEEPVPSLFTFNMPQETIIKLMGVVVEKTIVSIQGSKIKSEGPLLITHWGMSGPAILKLSAFGARAISEMKYKFNIQVNWVNELNYDVVFNYLKTITEEQPNKVLQKIKPYGLPERLWLYFLNKSELPESKKWGTLGRKGLNKLTSILTNDVYSVNGKTTFKEEFVTCGGVSLEGVDFKTMQSRVCKNLYFAGEVLDVDAITGGYNFQAAWTTGYIAGQLK